MKAPIPPTKIHAPSVAPDLILRPRILDLLGQPGERTGASLICAPAGYGKSTLVASWLKDEPVSVAWLSLDPHDEDPMDFFAGILAACRRVVSGFGRGMDSLLETDVPPAPRTLATSFVEAIGDTPITLVLDDYHEIKTAGIHDLVTEILRHPPPRLHLVIISRMDPALPIARFRAEGRLTEIRMEDLRFSTGEAKQFLEQSTGASFPDQAVEALNRRAEGWPAAIRLAAIAFGKSGELDRFLASGSLPEGHLRDYLVNEAVLTQQPLIREALLKTSILNRLCAPLCEAVCGGELSGSDFLESLSRANLFLIGLDDEETWFRYHHMFREMLQHNLMKQADPLAARELHFRAASWLEDHDQLEDAFEHLLLAEDTKSACELVRKHRQRLMDREEWTRLSNWMARIPEGIAEEDLELRITRAWILENRYRYPELFKLLDSIREKTHDLESKGVEIPDRLLGEVAALESGRQYLTGNGGSALELSRRALNLIPATRASQRGFAQVVRAISHQQLGNSELARASALEIVNSSSGVGTTLHARSLIASCFINWMEADVFALLKAGEQLIDLGAQRELPEADAFGRYFLGIAHLDRLHLDEAREVLSPHVLDPYPANSFNYLHATFALSLAHQIANRQEEAIGLTGLVAKWALDRTSPEVLSLTDAFEAEIAVRQGRSDEARAWTIRHASKPTGVCLRFYSPELSLVRVLLEDGDRASLETASNLISVLHAAFTSTHHRRMLIDLNLFRAVLQQAEGDDSSAIDSIRTALELARPGGVVRPFIEVGHHLGRLVQLIGRDTPSSFVGEILGALRKITASPAGGRVMGASKDLEQLTERETEIVALLAERLSDKEIAQRLFIAPGTVKKHLNNIYGKLNVHGRQEAAAKARDLRFI